MNLPFRQFIAVLLAIWLPLFSGNALAASIAMQFMGAGCHVAQPGITQSGAQHSHHGSSMDQHMQFADQSAGHQEQQNQQYDQPNLSHKNCGACQLACCGYLVTVTIEVAETRPLALSFTPSSTQFQSVVTTPLDPPPLARA